MNQLYNQSIIYPDLLTGNGKPPEKPCGVLNLLSPKWRSKAFLSLVFLLFTAKAFATDYYVSPTGKATDPGTQALPKTLAAAALIATTGDKVYLMAGTYRETAEIKKDGATFMPAPGVAKSAVIINGTDAMTSWTFVSGSVYSTTMSWDLTTESTSGLGGKRISTNQLFQDGSMIELARWPKRPATSTDADLMMMSYNAKADKVTFGGTYDSNNKAYSEFTIYDDDFSSETAGRWVGAKIWVNLARGGSGLDGQGWSGTVKSASGNTITVAGASARADNAPWGLGKDTEYFLFDPTSDAVTNNGGVEGLLAEGEWWKNGTTLYVKTRTGAEPASSATATSNLIEAKRRHFAFWPESGNHSGYIIQDFTFFACGLTTDRGFKLNEVQTTAQNITISNLTVKYPSHSMDLSGDWNSGSLGWTGLIVSGKNVVIQDCDISLSAVSAISLMGINSKALRNRLHENNYLCASSGVLNTGLGNCVDPEIAYNTIVNTTHQGINIRGIRNSNREVKHQARVHHNTIYDFMMRSHDSGAIDGSVNDYRWVRIDHNTIYNTRPEARVGGRRYGIYADYGQQASQDLNRIGATVDHNVIYDVNNPITINGGWDVHVFNNVLLTVTTPIVGNEEGSKGLTLGMDIGGALAGTNVKAYNNIVSEALPDRGSKPTFNKIDNITDAKGSVLSDLFVDATSTLVAGTASTRNYHLKSTATRAIDKGLSVAEYTNNYTDNEALVGPTDIGAFETSTSANPNDTTPPTAPGLAASNVTNKTGSSFDLSWTASTDAVGVVYYEVYANNVMLTQTEGTTFKVSGLEGATTYSIKIQAVDGTGNRSAFSTSLDVKTTAPVPNVDIAKTTATIAIDGTKEAAWGTTTQSITKVFNTAPTSAADLSGNWTAMWDATNLYVHIDVNDDTKIVDSGTGNWYMDDHIELMIDAEGTQPTGYGAKQHQYYMTRTGALSEYYHSSASLVDTKASIVEKPDGSGYQVEIKIPFSSLGVTAQALAIMGIEVQIGDDDDGAGEDTRMGWYSTNDQVYKIASLMGVAKLTAPGIADDTTPPTAPTGLTSSAIFPDEFTISWTASTDNLGVYSYEVFVDGILVGTPKVTTFTVKGLKEGTTYSVAVKAKDRFYNLSPLSSALKVITVLKASAVKYESENGTFAGNTGLAVATAVPGYSGTGYVKNLNSDAGGGSITYTVNVPAAGTYSAFLQYTGRGVLSLYINGTKVSNVDFQESAYVNAWDNYYGKMSLTNMVAGDNLVMIKHEGSAGGNSKGPLQDYLGVYVPTSAFKAPVAPTGLNATSITNTGFTLNWTASTDATVTGYDVYKDGSLAGSTTTGLSLNISTLQAGTTYDMTVKAKSSQGNSSDASSVLTVLTTGTGSTLVSGIVVTPDVNDMLAGASMQLFANITPTNANNKLLNWTSSSDFVATVDATGKVTAVNVGTANVTATSRDGSNKKSTAQINVTRPWIKVDDNALNSGIVYDSNWKTYSGNKGYKDTEHYIDVASTLTTATFTFTGTRVRLYALKRYNMGIAQVILDDGTPVNVDLYKSGDLAVDQLVYDSGEITSGSHTLKVKNTDTKNASSSGTGISLDAFEYSGYVVPAQTLASSVSVTALSTSIAVSGTTTVSATVSPSTTSNKTVKWTSSDTNIATVTQSGDVTGVKAGTATITATTADGSSKTGTVSITVTGSSGTVAVTSVTVSGGTSVTAGSTLQLSAAVLPDNATNKNVTWSSSNTSLATVSSSGVVTGVAAGSPIITATPADGSGKTGSVTVTVTAASSGSSTYLTGGTGYYWRGMTNTTNTQDINKTQSLAIGDNDLSTVVTLDDDSENAWQAAGLTWATAKTGINKVEIYHGTVANDGYDNGNFSANIKLQYQTAAGGTWTDASGWSLAPSYPYDYTVSDKTYTFTGSALSSVVAIRIIGQVRANNTSWAIRVKEVKAYTGGSSSTVAVTSVTVSPSSPSVTVGSTVSLTADAQPSTASNRNVTWSSDNTSKATVSSSGVVTGVAAGTATITATAADGSGKTGSVKVTVTAASTTASIDRTDAGGTATARGQISTTEGATKAFDNDFRLTKWLDLVATNTWIQFTFANSAKYAVDKYTITCGNDVPGRDPKTWRLLGTNVANPAASDFTEVHSVTDYSFGSLRNQTKEFIPTSKSTAYATYRLEIIANNDATTGKIQLNEIELFAPNNSSTTASIKEGQQLQLNQNTVAEKITVFPNPVTDGWLTVGLTSADKNNKVDVSLADLSGKIVYEGNFISNGISERLNIGNVQAGIYVIRITGSNTKFSAKIVVQ
jgi:uncharacterized protein YjdB